MAEGGVRTNTELMKNVSFLLHLTTEGKMGYSQNVFQQPHKGSCLEQSSVSNSVQTTNTSPYLSLHTQAGCSTAIDFLITCVH